MRECLLPYLKRACFAILLTLSILSGNAWAAEPTLGKADLQKCARITDDLARLACFDNLNLRMQGPPAVLAPTKGVGLWKVTSERSRIDDSTAVSAVLAATEPIGIRYKQAIPTLWARCKEGELDFYISWGVFIGSRGHEVTIRLDAQTARTDTWDVSTDHTATFYAGDRKAWFEELASARKLVVRTTPFGESPVLTSFPVAGFAQVRPALLKACDS